VKVLCHQKKRFVKSTIAVKALVTKHHNKNRIAEIWILDVYKGEDKLAAGLGLPGTGAEAVFHLKDQRVNVSHFGDRGKCWNELLTQKTYVILLQPNYSGKGHNAIFKARYDEPLGAAIDFSLEMERKLLKAMGWSHWSDWSPCSQSCDGGQQERRRECLLGKVKKSEVDSEDQTGKFRKNRRNKRKTANLCGSFNAEKRNCNSFSCPGAVNTLSVREERYFKPSPSAFTKVPERGPDAWQIRPGSYFLLPFKEAFGRQIPRDFTIFLTIKPTDESEGILFSLNARNSRQEYISLELNEGRLELVHSLPNGSNIIDIPAKINDGYWHQLAISIHGGSSVRTYLDCHWITTQVLHKHALNVPEDTDLIIGYMFQGELEQLTVVDESFGGVSEQCSPNKVPFLRKSQEIAEKIYEGNNNDFHIEESPEKTIKNHDHPDEKRKAGSLDYIEEEYVDLDGQETDSQTENAQITKVSKRIQTFSTTIQEDFEEKSDIEGSGQETNDDEDLQETSKNTHKVLEEEGSGDEKLDVEWSVWGPCTRTCGQGGVQKRTAAAASTHCMDNGFLEECVMASGIGRRRQTRPCNRRPCPQPPRPPRPPPANTASSPMSNSGWIPVRYETVTQNDVDHARHHDHNEAAEAAEAESSEAVEADGSILKLNLIGEKPTKRPHNPEEHTNVIPHIPNYWTPSDTSSIIMYSSSGTSSAANKNKAPLVEECWCANGGTCEYHNHIYGHHHPTRESATCKCRKGYVGKHCEKASCRPGCANGGLCVDPDVCSCPDGYTGARCQTAFCHPGCQNGGSCVAPFKCECPPGVTGAFCQEYSCQPQCGNGGVCIGHNLCSCPHGFSGPDCQDKTCTVHCENGGVCTMPDNKCKCRDGYYGARCHKKICQRYIAVREPHRQAYKQVVNVEYETICSDGLSCKKTRPSYRTIFRTVYRTAYKCSSDLEEK